MTVQELADQLFPHLTMVEGLEAHGADLQQGREATFLLRWIKKEFSMNAYTVSRLAP